MLGGLFLVCHFSCVFAAAAAEIAPKQSICKAGDSVPLSAEEVRAIEHIIGYSFKDSEWLQRTFCHRNLETSGFQQFEFLGNRTIAAILADYDFSVESPPEKLHAQLEAKTNKVYLARRFKELGLTRFLRTNPGSSIDTIFADAFEALVGAIQKDSAERAGELSAETKDFVLLYLNGIARPVRLYQVIVSVTQSSGEVLSETGKAQNPKTAKLSAVKKLWPQLFSTDGFSTKQMTWKPFAEGCKKYGHSVRHDTAIVEVRSEEPMRATMTTGARQEGLEPSFSYPAQDGRGRIFVHEGQEYFLPLYGNHGVPPLEADFTDQHIACMSESLLRQLIDQLKEDREKAECRVARPVNTYRPGELSFDTALLFKWNRQEIITADAILVRLEAVWRKRVEDRYSFRNTVHCPATRIKEMQDQFGLSPKSAARIYQEGMAFRFAERNRISVSDPVKTFPGMPELVI